MLITIRRHKIKQDFDTNVLVSKLQKPIFGNITSRYDNKEPDPFVVDDTDIDSANPEILTVE